ncbi:MAG: 4-hydroxythreonine-4-phosphate dehydrogenase PdxA [Bacteroidia bacterium]|nr:MAG: 4-hydroxythreonine-4-phosphate dehydrogenase PdxA [Bacteroidia bacterium]
MEAHEEKQTLVKIGISHGDVNSISYEIIMKALSDARLLELFTPIVYGSSKVASYHKKFLGIHDFNFHLIRNVEQALHGKANMVNIFKDEIKIDLGQSTETAGQAAFQSLEMATDDLAKGHIDALVTAPINKQNIQSRHFNFPGHTEYLTQKFGTQESLMLMVSNQTRIGVITGHIPLREVPGQISRERILSKVKIFNNSLKKDFGITKPKIALLGLNPHAGDKGVIGKEEQEVIIPAIKEAFDQGILLFGPYPADGFFGSASFSHFDGILTMYHDQGLIPFKTLSFKSGVNFTAGLPIVRTSPAHGTAFDLAGKNSASPEAFREAVYLAIDIVRNRKLFEEHTTNPLDVDSEREENDS